MKSSYSSMYANSRRDSFFEIGTNAKGAIAWRQKINETNHPLPITVFPWGTQVVTATVSDISVFDNAGNLLWSEAKLFCSPVVLADNLLWYQHPSHFLMAVDSTGKVVRDMESFPGGLGDTEHTQLLFPRETDFIASNYDLNQRDHDELTGENDSSAPEISIRKNSYGSTYSKWEETIYRTNELPPLYDPVLDIVSVVSQSEIIKFNISEEREVGRFRAPYQELSEWSLGQNGDYCFVGYENGKKVVVMMSQEGNILWQYTDAIGGDTWGTKWTAHPPVLGRDKSVYVTTEERVIAIKEGLLVWEQVFGQAERAFVSALADGSLLVAHGEIIKHLDSHGKVLFSLVTAGTIASQPVVNSSGTIYVATNGELLSIV